MTATRAGKVKWTKCKHKLDLDFPQETVLGLRPSSPAIFHVGRCLHCGAIVAIKQ